MVSHRLLKVREKLERFARGLLACSVTIVVLLAATMHAQADSRVALVIGNGDYEQAGKNSTAARNALVMARTLRNLGFRVQQASNLNQQQMVEQLRAFIRTSRLADETFFYYAGHAVTIDQTSYLIPTDAQATSLERAKVELIDIASVLEPLKSNGGTNIVLLEAGKSNRYRIDLANRLAAGRAEAISSTIYPVRPHDNLIIAGPTQAQATYKDGSRRISQFTELVAIAMAEEGREFKEILLDAAAKMSTRTKGKQVPWIASGVDRKVRLNGAPLFAPIPKDEGAAERAYTALGESNIATEYEAFLATYPKSRLASAALERLLWLKELDPAEREKAEARTMEYRATKAELKLAEMEREEKITLANSSGYNNTPIFEPMIALGDVALRSKPSSGGDWIGLLKTGEERFIVASVLGGSWLQVQLTPKEVERMYYIANKPAPQGNLPHFGFISARSLQPLADSASLKWREQLTAMEKDPQALRSFIDQNPEFLDKPKAIKLLLSLISPVDGLSDDPIENAGYLGDGVVRPALDISEEIAATGENSDIQEDLTGINLNVEVELQATQTDVSDDSQSDRPTGPKIVRIPEMGYSLEAFEQEYVTKSRSNLRRLPWVKTRKVATVNGDERLIVTGRVREVDWYRVRWGEGRDVYVWGELIEPYEGSATQAWEEIQGTKDPVAIEDYISRFPKGQHLKAAIDLLRTVRIERGLAGAPGGIVAPLPSSLRNQPSLDQPVEAPILNVYPVVVNGREHRELTRQTIKLMGNALGARAISDQNSTLPNTVVVLVEVLRQDVISKSPELAADAEETLESETPSFEFHSVVKVSLIDTLRGRLIYKNLASSWPVESRQPSRRKVDRALVHNLQSVVGELAAEYLTAL